MAGGAACGVDVDALGQAIPDMPVETLVACLPVGPGVSLMAFGDDAEMLAGQRDDATDAAEIGGQVGLGFEASDLRGHRYQRVELVLLLGHPAIRHPGKERAEQAAGGAVTD